MPGYYNQFPAAGQNYQPPVYPQQRQQYTPQNFMQNAYSQAAAAFNPFGSSYGFAPNRFTPVTMPYQSFYQPYQPQPSTSLYFDFGRNINSQPYNAYAQQTGSGGDLFSQVVDQVGGAQQPQPPRQSRFDRVPEVARDPIRPDIPETSSIMNARELVPPPTVDVMGQTIDLSQAMQAAQSAQANQANPAANRNVSSYNPMPSRDRFAINPSNMAQASAGSNPTARFSSPNAWGRDANPGSYVKDTWTGNGFLVKSADGRKFRVRSEEEAIRRSRGG